MPMMVCGYCRRRPKRASFSQKHRALFPFNFMEELRLTPILQPNPRRDTVYPQMLTYGLI